MPRSFLSMLFRWQPSQETLVAAVAGFLIIGLSAALLPVQHVPWLRTIIRDLGQVFLAGILFPLIYLRRTRNNLAEFGLSFSKWYIFLPINLVLGILLLALFLSKTPPPPGFRLDLWKVAFLLLTGIFEVVFFYSFQRTLFERAFGIVPGIVLAALFYAFHHVGFQPEYGSLIFVSTLKPST